MTENQKALVLASLLGDSLALGAHWEYDPVKLEAAHGRVEGLLAPAPGSYHAGKQAGDLTHYGDQTMVLLRSVAALGRFNQEDFFARWKGLFDGYQGYRDGATKQTLQRIDFGEGSETSGSPSNDLAGASRIAPILALDADPDALRAAAVAQTKMTHNNPQVLKAASFFARTTLAVLGGAQVVAALEKAAAETGGEMAAWAEAGLAATGGVVDVVGGFGRSCHAPDAVPGTVFTLAKHADDPRRALVETVMAGGDSAARALIVGMVLGARHGMAAVPAEWRASLRAGDEIEALLGKY